MSCPAWETCFHEECNKERVCMNAAYWSEYWKIKGKFVTLDGPKIVDKINLSTIDSSTRPKKVSHQKKKADDPLSLCSGIDKCDKQATCEFLGQCIFTISAVKGNKKVIKSLSGRHTMKEVLVVLAELNPKPMRSYYLHSKKKK